MSRYTTNRIAGRCIINGQTFQSNTTLNSYGTHSPATITFNCGSPEFYNIGTSFSVYIALASTGASSGWGNFIGNSPLEYSTSWSCPGATASPYQSVNETGDNYLKINWGADVSCDAVQYSIDGGASYHDISGYPTYTISGLAPSTTYRIVTRVRRQDSGLWSNTSVMNVTTLSSPYISALSDFNIGTSFSCTIYNPKGRTLNLYLYANDVANVVVRTTNSNGTYTFVTTEAENDKLYNSIPKAKNGKYRIAVVCNDLGSTRWSNDTVGYKTYYTVETDCKPTISITAIDINNDSIALTGSNSRVIKYISNVKATITATAKKGSTISSQKISCGDGNSGTGSTVVFYNVESGKFTGIVTDSRGYSASKDINLTLVDYVKLTLNIDVYRPSPTTGNVVAKYNGNYFNKNFGKVDNELNLKYHYKEHLNGIWSDWITLNPSKSGNTYSNGSSPINLGTDFDYKKDYDFEFLVNDKIYNQNEISAFQTVVSGMPIFDWGENDFNINGELKLYETSIMRHIANILYPVNSIYISLTKSIPEFLSGEWEYLGSFTESNITYYVYKRTNENEKITYNNEFLLYDGEEIYVENILLKGSDVL